MRKKLLFICTAALLAAAGEAVAQPDFTAFPDSTMGTGMSPSGRYVVGVNPYYNVYNTNMVSYLYDRETASLDWLTVWDKNDYSKGGGFSDVADNGTVCGTT